MGSIFNKKEYSNKGILYTTVRVEKDVSLRTEYYWHPGVPGFDLKYCFNINHYHSFFIELLANKEKCEPGWIDYTKSDFIFYVDAISNDCHIIHPFDIRNYLATHDYQTRECHKDKYKISVGDIVPLEEFGKEYYIKTISLKKYAA